MKSVILTGASGFIGRHCINHLLEADYEIHALCHQQKRADALPQAKGLAWHNIDLLDSAAVTELLKQLNCSEMIHLAWYAEPGKFWDSRLNLDWLRASVHLLKSFAETGGKRFVGAGSCAEYDWSSGTLSEATTELKGSTLYGTSKASMFQTALQTCVSSGMEFAWGRIFWLYGPGEDSRRIVPYVINQLLEDEEALCSDGLHERDFLYVDDVARAFVLLLGSGVQGAINIASGKAVSIKLIAETIAKLIDKEDLLKLGAITPATPEAPLVVADVSRLHNELKFAPEVSLEDGLLKSLQWWQAQADKTTQPA